MEFLALSGALLALVLWLTLSTRSFFNHFPSIRPDIEDSLHRAGVPEAKFSDCLSWAFGEDYNRIEIHFWDDRWRERHSDLFMVRGSDPLYKSLEKIGRAYLERVVKP